MTTVTAAKTDTNVAGLPEIADPSQVAPKDARQLARLFFDQLAVLEEGTPEHSYARNTLIEMNMSLVRFAAGRFRSRGPEEMEDIVQVGMIGLISSSASTRSSTATPPSATPLTPDVPLRTQRPLLLA